LKNKLGARSILILFSSFFLSCDIDEIATVYQNQWQLKLSEELTLPTNGFFSGLSELSDGSILAVQQSIGENNDTNLSFLTINRDAIATKVETISLPNFSIDLDHTSTGQKIEILGQSKTSLTKGLIITLDDKLETSLNEIDLSSALANISLVRRHLSEHFLYLSGQDIPKQTGYSVVKTDRQGEIVWSSFIGEHRPLQLIEGSNETLFVLEQDTDNNQSLIKLEKDGGIDWTSNLTGDTRIVPNMKDVNAIIVSPSNTITAVGTNTANQLMLAFIDPRGNFMFQKFLGGFELTQFHDFIITKDGGFMVALSGNRLETNISVVILRLNHRAVITWQSDFVLNNLPDKVSLLELSTNEVVIMTNEGNMINVVPE